MKLLANLTRWTWINRVIVIALIRKVNLKLESDMKSLELHQNQLIETLQKLDDETQLQEEEEQFTAMHNQFLECRADLKIRIKDEEQDRLEMRSASSRGSRIASSKSYDNFARFVNLIYKTRSDRISEIKGKNGSPSKTAGD